MNNTDIFILIPVSGSLRLNSISTPDYLNSYIRQLNDTALYECDIRIAESIERESIGVIKVAYMSDEYSNSLISWMNAYTCYSYQASSDLGVLAIIIPQCQNDASQVADIVLSGHLRVSFMDAENTVNDFITALGLSQAGKPRIIYCNSKSYSGEEKIGYLLAGETWDSQHGNFKLRPEVLNELRAVNVAKYDFYDLYLSEIGAVYLIDGYSDDALKNLENESLLLFICEIAILQNAAISRINKQMVDALIKNNNISAFKALNLQVEFGKTILLWDNTIYRYYIAQSLSDDIVKAFRLDRLIEEYNKNCKHIEQITALKDRITSDIEGKILNILAFILSVSELIGIMTSFVSFAKNYPLQIGLSGTGIALLVVILLIIKRRLKK